MGRLGRSVGLVTAAVLALAAFPAAGAGDARPTGEAARLERGCEAGNAEACSGLGSAYANGSGVERDEARAGALFDKACRAGSRSGCSRREWLVERLVGSGRHALARAALAEVRAAYEEALERFELALRFAPGHEQALAGRAEATRRLDALRERAGIGFSQDETSVRSPAGAAAAAARLEIEATPAAVEVGEPFVLRYFLANRGREPLALGAVSVRNRLGSGGVSGGAVEPRTRSVAAGSRALLTETRLVWSWDPATEWSSTLTVVLEDGSVYSSTLRSRRE